MNRAYLYQTLSLALLLSTSACNASAQPTPAATQTPLPTAAPTLVPTPEPTLEPTTEPTAEATALPFAPATFTDSGAGFAFDYPADWTLDPSSQIGIRGAQALLLSPGTTLETLPDGGTRISIITNIWDPKNDLDAYVAQRKVAWNASGFTIEREDQWQLADGRTVYLFVTLNPSPVLNLFTTAGEDYLQLTAEGDLALAEAIFRTLRPTE